ncbi:hypothetical protein [Pantoea sp. KPR_PJ]|uniref:hypothetical protein n=1 Tax=Pantoea sp. KPR_PJ TaxID=2738375 RepID=UPI0035278C68
MRKSSALMLVTFSLLCGCQAATPQEARMKNAVVSEHSSRSVDQVSRCIYQGWSTTQVVERDSTTHIEHEENRLTVFTWEDSMFADVYKQGSGTAVRFYKTFNMGPEVLADRSRIVKRCT